jgi:CO/xanthine dehydrogenase Mo-binding subunit
MLAVLNAVVKKAGWTPGVGSTGQGVGVALSFDGNSYVGEVAKVQVNQETGEVKVLHMDAVIDCGLCVNPMGAADQVEGAIVLSMSPTLTEEITFKDGVVTNPTFGQYKPLRMADAPTVSVDVLQNVNEKMGGVGEPGVAPVPGAVANAIYDAIGVRLFELPFTPDRVLAAIKAKADAAATPTA